LFFSAANQRYRGYARPDRHFAIYRAAATESIIVKPKMTVRENTIATSAPASPILTRLAVGKARPLLSLIKEMKDD
jgi:hypothetical protein